MSQGAEVSRMAAEGESFAGKVVRFVVEVRSSLATGAVVSGKSRCGSVNASKVSRAKTSRRQIPRQCPHLQLVWTQNPVPILGHMSTYYTIQAFTSRQYLYNFDSLLCYVTNLQASQSEFK